MTLPENSFSELTVILKDESRTYRQKFPLYSNYYAHYAEPLIQHCIEEAKKSFDGEPDDIKIKISIEIN